MDEETLTVWLDTALLMLGSFILMTMLLLSIPEPTPQTQTEAGITSPGQVIAEMEWANGLPDDIDLWVEAPGDKPVGYSNKAGKNCNLLRDDLGDAADSTQLNYEVTFCRSAPPGEYTVNVHYYRMAGKPPVDVTVVIRGLDKDGKSVEWIKKTVQLNTQNEEVTVFRFKVDADGYLVAGSVHDLHKDLRVAK